MFAVLIGVIVGVMTSKLFAKARPTVEDEVKIPCSACGRTYWTGRQNIRAQNYCGIC
jgi:uncharacterized protein with PIN domain